MRFNQQFSDQLLEKRTGCARRGGNRLGWGKIADRQPDVSAPNMAEGQCYQLLALLLPQLSFYFGANVGGQALQPARAWIHHVGGRGWRFLEYLDAGVEARA